jgi:hypothetical protein
MAWIGAVIGLAVGVVGGMSAREGIKEAGDQAYEEGFATQAEREWEAKQHDYFATQERASAQRTAYEERRIGRIAESRAVAVAAFGGGGVDDPTVLNIIGDIHQETEYRALFAIYEGGQKARIHDIEASLLRYEGAQAVRAGQIRLQESKYAAQATKFGTGQQAASAAGSVGSSWTSGRQTTGWSTSSGAGWE